MFPETIILGGGLSGLFAASLLQKHGRPFVLLEARNNFGGRIRTAQRDGHAFELGPSWFWPELNPRLAGLVEQLGLPHYAQHTFGDVLIDAPPRTLCRRPHHEVDPRHARRLLGGTSALVDALLAALPTGCLHTEHRVTAIAQGSDHLVVNAKLLGGKHTFHARQVILALPPRLVAATITFTPALPQSIRDALHNIPTWMAGDAKFFALYDEPFWRADGLSGTAFSDTGPLSESHDASLPHGPAALMGFLIPDHQERLRLGEDLIPTCLAQLVRYFGPAAGLPRETILQDWSAEPLTATEHDLPLFEHPSYGLPADCESLWDGRLHFAGTEFASEHGGYMEGALEAAERAVGRVLA